MKPQGILTGIEIKRRLFITGEICIAPYHQEQLNPSSYDLTLGPRVIVYDGANTTADTRLIAPQGREVFIEDEGLVLIPGVGYLMHTLERVRANNLVGVIDGKSSLGRLFLSVHQTAGYVDPGFDGQYTLEVSVLFPVKVYRGMRIAQVRFHTVCGEVSNYTGKYRDSRAVSCVPSDTAGLVPKTKGSP